MRCDFHPRHQPNWVTKDEVIGEVIVRLLIIEQSHRDSADGDPSCKRPKKTRDSLDSVETWHNYYEITHILQYIKRQDYPDIEIWTLDNLSVNRK